MDPVQTSLSPRGRRRIANQAKAARIQEGITSRLRDLQTEHRGSAQVRAANSAAWLAARPQPDETVDQVVDRCAKAWLEAYHAQP